MITPFPELGARKNGLIQFVSSCHLIGGMLGPSFQGDTMVLPANFHKRSGLVAQKLQNYGSFMNPQSYRKEGECQKQQS